MPSRRYQLKPKEGEEISVSILAIDRREEMLWVSSDPIPEELFPPCIRDILRAGCKKGTETNCTVINSTVINSTVINSTVINSTESKSAEGTESRKGGHRLAAILAAFLGQAGWNETDAKQLWSLSKAANVDEVIFSKWFQKMHCPKCETLKRASDGYPDLGIANLGLCQPDEKCREFLGPVEYACDIRTEEDRIRGHLLHVKTLYHARIFDWSSGREGEIELSEAEKLELESLLKEQIELKDAPSTLIYTRAKVRGRLRHKFFLKEAEGPRRQMLSDLL